MKHTGKRCFCSNVRPVSWSGARGRQALIVKVKAKVLFLLSRRMIQIPLV